MTDQVGRASMDLGDRKRFLSRWREFSAEVEGCLEAESLQAGDALLTVLGDVFGRYLAGECSIKEATQLALASRALASQLARYEDRREVIRTAWHESGHAVVAVALGLPLAEVRAGPELGFDSAGQVTMRLVGVPTREDLEMFVVTVCAGRAAMEIAREADCITGTDDDEMKIQQTVLSCRPTMGQMEAVAFTSYCRYRAAETLRRNWPAVEQLAEALLQRGTIPGAEAEEIIYKAAPALRPTLIGVTLAA